MILVFIALYVIYMLASGIRQLLVGLVYKSRNPSLLRSSLAFGTDWDIGQIEDGSQFLLLQLFATRRIPRKEIIGYTRVDGQQLNEPPAVNQFKLTNAGPAVVTLKVRDQADYRLHYGNPLAADRLCLRLRESGIQQLYQGVIH